MCLSLRPVHTAVAPSLRYAFDLVKPGIGCGHGIAGLRSTCGRRGFSCHWSEAISNTLRNAMEIAASLRFSQ